MWKKVKVGIKSMEYAGSQSRARVVASSVIYLSGLYLEYLALIIRGISYKSLQVVVLFCIRTVLNTLRWVKLSVKQTGENISEGEQR